MCVYMCMWVFKMWFYVFILYTYTYSFPNHRKTAYLSYYRKRTLLIQIRGVKESVDNVEESLQKHTAPPEETEQENGPAPEASGNARQEVSSISHHSSHCPHFFYFLPDLHSSNAPISNATYTFSLNMIPCHHLHDGLLFTVIIFMVV